MQKSINVNESSIIDLKAELYRKEEQFKQNVASESIKAKESQTHKGSKTLDKLAVLSGKKKIHSKRKLEEERSLSKQQKSEVTSCRSSENDADYEKAKLKLQAKAKLYDKMSKGDIEDPEDGDDSFYLVDFHKKVYGSDENAADDRQDGCGNSNDEWVEFEDSLGRNRKCLRSDLEKFKSLDQEFRPINRSPSPPTQLLSEDMRREMMRKKWEEEQEKLIREGDRDIHYQNLLFDEVRDHGVAYYQFSKDEAERKSQMETLNLLREQTLDQRSRREALKQKRKAALDARLAKVRQKKLQREGSSTAGDEEGPATQPDKNEATNENDLGRADGPVDSPSAGNAIHDEVRKNQDRETGPTLSSTTGSSTTTESTPSQQLEESINKHKGVKHNLSQWINSLREERNDEFAPPSFYSHQNTRGHR